MSTPDQETCDHIVGTEDTLEGLQEIRFSQRFSVAKERVSPNAFCPCCGKPDPWVDPTQEEIEAYELNLRQQRAARPPNPLRSALEEAAPIIGQQLADRLSQAESPSTSLTKQP